MAALDFPSSPTNGQVYTSGTTSWSYSTAKTAWIVLGTGFSGYTGSQGYTGSRGYTGSLGYVGSKGTTQTGTTPPASPISGDQWWDSETGNLYVYYDDGTSAQWVQQSLGASVAGGNTNIQFNDSGAAAGTSALTFDKTTNVMKINNVAVPDMITMMTFNLAL